MQRSSSAHESVSPCSSEQHLQDYFAVHRPPVINQCSLHVASFDDALNNMGYLDPAQNFLNSWGNPHNAQTNTAYQASPANSNVGDMNAFLQTRQSYAEYNETSSRGTAKNAEPPGVVHAAHEMARPHQDFPEENTETLRTPYSIYRGLFLNSDAARDHRHLSTRFGRQPYRQPEDDPTIAEVEDHRMHHVGRIYNAMVCGDRAQDNPGSIAMKRWVNGAHYKSDVIEAFAHKVFDCLLAQVKEGFRGWHHNDYVDDDRKLEKEDRDADCASRLENILDALEQEKTICEDVMNSATQIRMFVNAPIAYAARKHQNRLGNSKRSRGNATDPNPRPVKARRNAERSTRAWSTTVSERPVSRDTTPNLIADSVTSPYYRYGSSTSRKLPTISELNYFAPRQPSKIPHIPTIQPLAASRHATATAPPSITSLTAATSRSPMSPPILPASYSRSTYATARSPTQTMAMQLSYAPTPPLHHSYHSAPPSPDIATYSTPATSPDIWPNGDSLNDNPLLPIPIDPSLTATDFLFDQSAWSDELHGPAFCDQLNESHVALSDIEHASRLVEHDVDDSVVEFESLWNAQEGVQPFSFGGGADSGAERY